MQVYIQIYFTYTLCVGKQIEKQKAEGTMLFKSRKCTFKEHVQKLLISHEKLMDLMKN